jgi:hypothetical protein
MRRNLLFMCLQAVGRLRWTQPILRCVDDKHARARVWLASTLNSSDVARHPSDGSGLDRSCLDGGGIAGDGDLTVVPLRPFTRWLLVLSEH